jgi:hypothetical protein
MNVETGYPVRVIRGPNGAIKYSPLKGCVPPRSKITH